MSESDKPQGDQAPPPQPQEPERPHRGVEKLRAKQKTGKVPHLDKRDLSYAFGGKVDAFDAELEGALESDLAEAMAGMSEKDMEQLYGEQRAQPAKGEQGGKKGKVVAVRGKDVFVDVGGRTQGLMPVLQFPDGPPSPGDEVEVHIEGFHPDGLLLLTRKGAAVEADWSSVAKGMIVEARVTATNKGGLTVDVNGIRGFMPIGHIDIYRVDDPAPFVNQKLLCMVIEVDREDRNLVVSRRALLQREKEKLAEKFWAEVAEGQVREGVVRTIRPFGAFVDLGGADALLPVSEVSWQRVKDPSDVVKEGQRVRVTVLRIDPEARKLTVGLRQLTASPWDDVQTDHPIGSVTRGKVTRTADFGAFVEVAPGVEGLIHISELAPGRVGRVTDVVKVDQEVNVKVLSIDVEARRMSLSLKQALKAPEPKDEDEEDEDEAPPPPVKKRTTPLRGGVGSRNVELPKPGE